MANLQLTPWFRMNQKPVREGEYEGRDRLNPSCLRVVFWKRLQDTPAPGWYYDKGYYGPFKLWQDATNDITAWRGVLKSKEAP